MRFAAHDHPAAPRGERVLDALGAHDDAAGREIRTLDELHQVVHRHVVDGVVMVDQVGDAVGNFGQVVGRDVGGHAHRDTRRAVDEQVREQRGQHFGLLQRAVEVIGEVDRFLVDVGQHLGGDGREPRLGVAHGRRAIAVERAEVALAVDQRVAHGEVLGHAHQRVVDGHVTVRVVLAQDLADDTSAFLIGRVGANAQVVHGIEHAAVHRLEPVAHIGQRAGHDDAHGVVQVRDLHFGFDVALLDDAHGRIDGRSAGIYGVFVNGFFSHGSVSRLFSSLKRLHIIPANRPFP